MNTFLLWVNKGSRKPKVQGKATAAAAALTIFDFSRMARKGAGRFYVVDAATADAARAAIDAFERQSGQGLDVPVSETKFEGGGKITAIGARANQALEGAGVSISKWDERLARQGRVTDAQARALNNPRGVHAAMAKRRKRNKLSKGQQRRAKRRYSRMWRQARLGELQSTKRRSKKRNVGKRKRASRRVKQLRKSARKYSRGFQSAMGFLPVPGTRIRRYGATYRARPFTVTTGKVQRNPGGWIERWHATVYEGSPSGKKLVFEQKGYKSPRDPGMFRVKIGSKVLYEGRDYDRAEALYQKAPLW